MKSFLHRFLLCLFLLFSSFIYAQNNTSPTLKSYDKLSLSYNDVEVKIPLIIVQNVDVNVKVSIINNEKARLLNNKKIYVYVNDELKTFLVKNNQLSFKYKFHSKETLKIKTGEFAYQKTVNPIPLWMSILPPLIAIIMALIFKEVFSALFIGLLFGTSIIQYYQGATVFTAIFKGMFSIVDTYLINALNNKDHLSIIIFSMLIGATVNLITQNGGMKGIVNYLSKYAKTPVMGQLITWFLGIIIFFDDYANTLVVGNTMRPITDKLKISREKLSYIVDSTAAPVASLALITTWIGVELSYIQDGINAIGINQSAYDVFMRSLSTRFYPIFTLIFIFILIMKKREFGPMLTAERKARNSDKIILDDQENSFSNKLNDLEISESIKARWYNAAIPVLVIILGTLTGLIYTGFDTKVWNDVNMSFFTKLSVIIGNSDSFKSLLWASLLGTVIALILTKSQKILTLKQSIDSLINGCRTMLTAIIILVLAWSLALVTENMHTADFISLSLTYLNVSPYMMPAITFIMAGIISFSTGSSWGTMAILYPLILPASWMISKNYGMEYSQSLLIFYNVVSSILAGSVLGDHCSPISDTTILSSLASSCNHIQHVRTQLPYALTVGGVSVIIGTIPAAYGVSSFILFPAGILILYFIIVVFGKKI
ncbi:MAG: Na+/H+ antiporter NhaC family protein [Bacteroidales bacterium]|nr:Na+/H+ antiporter NhaC family protein [Bacteroidales bacterium]